MKGKDLGSVSKGSLNINKNDLFLIYLIFDQNILLLEIDILFCYIFGILF